MSKNKEERMPSRGSETSAGLPGHQYLSSGRGNFHLWRVILPLRCLFLSSVLVGLAAAAAVAGSVGDSPTSIRRTSALCKTPDRSEVRIQGGAFLMGSQKHEKEEGPVRRVEVESFSIDRFDVTNGQFAKFVAATGYVTDAERKPDPRDYPDIPHDRILPGGAVFKPGAAPPEYDLEWWVFVEGANWRHPYDPDSTIVGHENEPVVQVSYNDALAFASWAGRALPTEEQYEYATRGGLNGKSYAWGDELTPAGQWMANVWQGHFPDQNTGKDGYRGLAPVGCFPPNGYGLYDMIGNVWKWTASFYSLRKL